MLVDQTKFTFKHLPHYAQWLKENRLKEFVELILRHSREQDLPLLKALSNLPEETLIQLSEQSYLEIFDALSQNKIADVIQQKLDLWVRNALVVVDKDQIVAEDITIAAYIRRKTYYHFIESYTNDLSLYKLLIDEIDRYTTQEELLSYSSYISMQQEKLRKTNEELALHEGLLLEAQELGEMGSYMINFLDRSKSIYTPQYRKILEADDGFTFENFITYVHPQDQQRTRSVVENALRQGGEMEITYRYIANGKEKMIWSKGVAVVQDGVSVSLTGTIRDITKKHELLERLKESNNLYQLAQELTHLGNWSWDIQTNKVNWSDEMYRIYGIEPQSEEITFDRFISLIHPDYREARIQEISSSLQTLQAPDYTLAIITPAGDHRILKGHGWVETDYQNKPIRLHGTCQDITNEYNLNQELILLNETLSDKNTELERINAELESFNYIASHDLKEPLRKILTFSNLLLEEKENISERGNVFIGKVISSASMMQRLISDLIDFSQVSLVKESFDQFDLNQLVEEVRSSLSEPIEEAGASLLVQPLPAIQGVRFQFHQLFTNIIGNAIKYRRTDVSPLIEIKSETVSGAALNPKYKESGYLQITIRDNGIGFDPVYKERIFDLFQRLHSKDSYSGTGIGLAICKKIVQQHNGFIEAESEKGKGSIFRILLPQNSA